ncbi:MAG TPA: alpha/beta fold hydrolase [Candidatus Limnocylindria bacterium]|nr:alpha/beta fold hydrolase [Candidatus Limnocylindria bacterium]
MSTFDFEGKKVFYRSVGEGRPLLLLNGIMMSTKSWEPFLDAFQQGGNSPLLVDMLDQGESDEMDGPYGIEVQARMLTALLEELHIAQAAVFGASYGGEVALHLAVTSPHLVGKLALANTVARTSAWLKEIGDAWILAAGNPLAYYSTTIPVIYSPDFYDRRADWMAARKDLLTRTAFASPSFLRRMERLTRSAESHDVRDRLHEIACPTLIFSSGQDHVTPVEEQEYLRDHIPGAQHVHLPKTGHAAFYERPDLFAAILMGFVNHRPGLKVG